MITKMEYNPPQCRFCGGKKAGTTDHIQLLHAVVTYHWSSSPVWHLEPGLTGTVQNGNKYIHSKLSTITVSGVQCI